MTAKNTKPTDTLPEGHTWVIYLNEWPINILPAANHKSEPASIFDTPVDCLDLFSRAFASEGVSSMCVQSTMVSRPPPRGKSEMIVQQWINKDLPAMAFIKNRKTPVINYIANALTQSGSGVFQLIEDSEVGNYPLARAEDMHEYATSLYLTPGTKNKGEKEEVASTVEHIMGQKTIGLGATPTDWATHPQPGAAPVQASDKPEVFEQPDGSFVDAKGNPVIINT